MILSMLGSAVGLLVTIPADAHLRGNFDTSGDRRLQIPSRL
jgi:hypothetical protein